MTRILIVDDMLDHLFLLEGILREGGYAVTTVQNGAEALQSARSAPPDLVITDLLMPVMDGYTLCREWRADKHLQQIPLIVYTATFTEKQDESLALSLGADRFVLKPQDGDILLGIIQDVLASERRAVQHPADMPEIQETVVLKEYSEALFRKLEKKMADLEEANRELAKSEEKFSGAFHISPVAIFITDFETSRFSDVNEAFAKVFGYSKNEIIGESPSGIGMWVTADERNTFLARVKRDGECLGMSCRMLHKDGSVLDIVLSARILRYGNTQHLLAICDDVTETRKLQEQLFQSQKMETIGRLAGGVAHDFNNMLAISFIAVELLRKGLEENSPLLAHIKDIEYAAKRSRDITLQLLAFSRKQMIAPQPCDLNMLIAKMEKSLLRLVGEDIELRFVPGNNLGKILIDPSQVDQILMNLAVNARDAMPHGGKLTIETANNDIGEGSGRERVGFVPGRYVRLVVSDNGIGVRRIIFSSLFLPPRKWEKVPDWGLRRSTAL